MRVEMKTDRHIIGLHVRLICILL